jgi:hypothetical protein
MTTDASEPQPTGSQTAATHRATEPHLGRLAGRAVRRIAGAHIGRAPVGGLVSAVALLALLGAAYNIGNPSGGAGSYGTLDGQRLSADGAPTAAPAAMLPGPVSDTQTGKALFGSADQSTSGGETGTTPEANSLTAALETTQIVKTGSMALEVTDLDKAVSQAQATIMGMGGYVSQSSRSGDKDSAVATVTYRLPAARWDDALGAMRKLGSRVISEQTDSTDITAQVIDLDARLSNLKATESALQSIMTRATAITDVLAVEEQLSQVEGQIEQLTAQRDHLKDQAAMSTLSVSFSTPGKTVTTLAASEWALGAQVDESVAALVHIGQGLATIVVWAVIVGLPVVIGLALLWLIWRIVRRITRRRRGAPAGA